MDDGTGGYWSSVGRLDRATSVELWLDHYSGLSMPRLWMGFSSASSGPMLSMAKMAKLAGFSREPIKRGWSDITTRKPYRFIHPLQPAQFEHLVYEAYPPVRHFLGIFKKYPWPFGIKIRKLIVAEFENLLVRFTEAMANVSAPHAHRLRTPGPWARPDKRVEKAAVAFVRRKLIREGYKVKSCEHIICGYDLDAVRGAEHRCVEVKGCSGTRPGFFITLTERNRAETDPLWELAIVMNPLSRNKHLEFFSGAEMKHTFELTSIQWRGLPRKRR
jgi:hypothetical protein